VTGPGDVKNRWELTPQAFDHLLATLDPDRDLAGHKYESLRRKLVKFFEWRALSAPEDQADEALNRVARRIAEGERINDLPSYLTGVARLLALEASRQQQHERSITEWQLPLAEPESRDEARGRLDCLDRCIQRLPPTTRRLIIEYYEDEKHAKIEHRRALAARLDMPLSRLRVRMHRLREKLEQCVEDCLSAARLPRNGSDPRSV